MDTLVNLLNSNYKNDSIAILRNLCFNIQNRIILLSSSNTQQNTKYNIIFLIHIIIILDIFFNGFKTMLEKGNLTNQQYKDISLAIWSISSNNQKARVQLRHWGIDKYFEKINLLLYDDETRTIINRTYQILKN